MKSTLKSYRTPKQALRLSEWLNVYCQWSGGWWSLLSSMCWWWLGVVIIMFFFYGDERDELFVIYKYECVGKWEKMSEILFLFLFWGGLFLLKFYCLCNQTKVEILVTSSWFQSILASPKGWFCNQTKFWTYLMYCGISVILIWLLMIDLMWTIKIIGCVFQLFHFFFIQDDVILFVICIANVDLMCWCDGSIW